MRLWGCLLTLLLMRICVRKQVAYGSHLSRAARKGREGRPPSPLSYAQSGDVSLAVSRIAFQRIMTGVCINPISSTTKPLLWWQSLCLCRYPCSGSADLGLPDDGRKIVAHGYSLEQL